MSEGSEGGERQVPFYCPYCGDQDLRPAGATGGSWQCTSCARGFELRFTGVIHASQESGETAPLRAKGARW